MTTYEITSEMLEQANKPSEAMITLERIKEILEAAE